MVRSAMRAVVTEDSIHCEKSELRPNERLRPFCLINLCSEPLAQKARERSARKPYVANQRSAGRPLCWPGSEFRHLLTSKEFQRPRHLVRRLVAIKEAADFGARQAGRIAPKGGTNRVRGDIAQRVAENESARVFAIPPNLERRRQVRHSHRRLTDQGVRTDRKVATCEPRPERSQHQTSRRDHG